MSDANAQLDDMLRMLVTMPADDREAVIGLIGDEASRKLPTLLQGISEASYSPAFAPLVASALAGLQPDGMTPLAANTLREMLNVSAVPSGSPSKHAPVPEPSLFQRLVRKLVGDGAL